MEVEMKRLSTFNKWPSDAVYPSELAYSGLYYKGYEDEVECFSCQIRLRSWRKEDDPVQKHKNANPHCDYIEQILGNGTSSENNIQTGPRLDEDGTNNIFNDAGSENINLTDDYAAANLSPIPSVAVSSRQFRSTVLSTSLLVADNKPVQNTITSKSNLLSNENDMKFEKFRLASFCDWPKSDFIKPEVLAKDGFFYMGTGDRVQCAFCKGILRTWEPGDDPEVEHTRHYPECGFVLGNDVGNVPLSVDPRRKINAIRDEMNRISTFQSKFSIDAREIKARLDTPQVRLLVERGYSMDIIRLVLEERLRTYGSDFPSIVEFIKAVTEKKILLEAAVVSQRPAQEGIGAEHISTTQRSAHVAENKKEFVPNKFVSSTILEKIKVPGPPALPAMINQPPPASSRTPSSASAGPSSNIASVAAKDVKRENETEKTADEKSKAKKKKKKNKKAGKNGATNKTEEDETAEENSGVGLISSNVTMGSKESDIFTTDDSHLCAICQDKEINTAFIPCGHASTCDKCSESLKNCPMCRKLIDERFRIYLS